MKVKSYVMLLMFWLSVGALYLLSLYLDAQKFNTGFQLSLAVIVTTGLVYFGWACVTTVLFHWLKKPIVEGRWLGVAGCFVIGMLVTVPLITYLDRSVVALLENRPVPSVWAAMINIQYVLVYFNLLMYVLVFIVCSGLIFQHRSKQLLLQTSELAKQQAEMKMLALQSQLSPQFLFNCLNGLSGLVRVADQKQVIQAIARLGDLLRYAVRASQESITTLADELDFMDHYVALQKLRLGDQFVYTIKCDETLLTAASPPFLLHTLVENAFVHGMQAADLPLSIEVVIVTKQDQLVIQVRNNRNSEDPSSSKNGLGVALSNLKNRLALQFNEDFMINQQLAPGHYLAQIQIPLFEA